MFDVLEGTVDQARERRRAARRREFAEMRADEARKEQRKAQLVRDAEDDDDWRDAGCNSPVQWFMQLYACDYRTAQRIVRASEALRILPALEEALAAGELTLDQTVAAAELATPETDAELARIADALVTLATQPSGADAGVRRSPTTVIVHLSEDEPPFIEGAGAISVETAERLCCDARRLTIKPHGSDLVHSRITRCASYPQMRALIKRSKHCQYPGCTATRELEGHHIVHDARGGKAVLENMILLCPRHHTLLHDNHMVVSGSGANPVFTDANPRAITANQPHAPPR